MRHFIRLTIPVLLTLLFLSCENKETLPLKSDDTKIHRVRSFWEAYNRATLLRTSGSYEEAEKAYEHALHLDPQHEESLYYLGSSQLELGAYANAIQTYRRLLKLNPRSSRTLSQLGVLLSTPAPGAILNPEEAREMFDRVIRLNQEESGPFLRLGMLALRLNDRETAEKHFKTAAGFKSPEGIFFSGFMRFQNGQFREAIAHFQRVLEINRNEKRISGRGVFSEGDIKTSISSLSLMEKAGVKALAFLYWSAEKLGGYPQSVPAEFRIVGKKAGTPVRIRQLPGAGRGVWCDLNSDSLPDLILVSDKSTRIFLNDSGLLREAPALSYGGYDAVCGDFNGDQRQDFYIISNGPMGEGRNVLWKNEANGIFRDATESTGLGGRRATATAAFGDLDGDSDLDLIEAGNASAGNAPLRLYWNRDGKFHLQTIPIQGNAVSLAIADYNADRSLDLLVLQWKRPVLMFQNDTGGHFTDVTSRARLQSVGGTSFSAVFVDYNHDAWPDLFVSQYASYETALLCFLQPALKRFEEAPVLFVNESGNRFRNAGKEAGLSHAYGTMQAKTSDIDRDGWMDIVLASGGLEPWRLEPSVILRNLQGKGFAEWSYFPPNEPANVTSISIEDTNADSIPEIWL